MTRLELGIEAIGQALIDFMQLSKKDPEEKEVLEATEDILDCAIDGYCIIQWPDSQLYMEKEWFQKEAILDVEGIFGSSAYFIPIKRLVNKD